MKINCVWLRSILPGRLDDLDDPHTHFTSWLDLIRGPYWLRLLKAARELSIKHALTAVPCDPSHEEQVEASTDHFCYDCGRVFCSFNELKNHAHRSHGFISDARRFAFTCQCLVCLTIFGSLHAIVQHLSDRIVCLDMLRMVYEPLSYEDCKALDHAALMAARSSSVKAPARRAFGPRIVPCMSGTPRRIFL